MIDHAKQVFVRQETATGNLPSFHLQEICQRDEDVFGSLFKLAEFVEDKGRSLRQDVVVLSKFNESSYLGELFHHFSEAGVEFVVFDIRFL